MAFPVHSRRAFQVKKVGKRCFVFCLKKPSFMFGGNVCAEYRSKDKHQSRVFWDTKSLNKI